MPDPTKDVKQAIGELGMAEPVVWIGRKLAQGGELLQRGYEAVKRKVSGPPPKDPRIGRTLVKRPTGQKRMTRK